MALLSPRFKSHSALDGRVPLDRFLHPNIGAAVAALNRVGAQHLPDLDLNLQHERVDPGKRLFGILQDHRLYGPPTDRRVRELLQASFKNTKARRSRRYLHCSPRFAKNLLGRLHVLGVHLPWDWKPGNYDLTLRLARMAREYEWHFDQYFSQSVVFSDTADPRRHKVKIGGLYPQPIQPQSQDERIGPTALVLEVNVR